MVSQAQHLAWMRDGYPDLWERMKERIAEGRLEPTGSMWVEADCNIPSGESLVRQIVYGKRFYLDELGIETNDVWLPDVFGYSRRAAPDHAAERDPTGSSPRSSPGTSTTSLPHHSFLWEGIDGSRVFTHFPPADTYSGNVSVRELRFGVENFKDHDRATRSLYLFGWGDGGGGPTSEMLESARRLADIDGLPRLVMEGPRRFFTEAEAEIDDPAVWVGELYLEFHRGTYTSQAATKLGNRRAEFALREAEMWSALAPVSDYPARRARRPLEAPPAPSVPRHHPRVGHPLGLRRHRSRPRPHPGRGARAWPTTPSPGTPVPSTRPAADTRSSSSTRSHMPARSWSPRRVPRRRHRRPSTPSGNARPVQRDPDGRALFEATVPACGYAVYDFVGRGARRGRRSRRPMRDRSRTNICASSSTTRACCRRSSTSPRGREVLAPGARGNRFQLHPDYPNFFDAWDIDRFSFDQVIDLDEVESVELVERGPLRAAIRVTRRFGELSPHPAHPARLPGRGSSISTPRSSGTRPTDSSRWPFPSTCAAPGPPMRSSTATWNARPTPTPVGTSPVSRSAHTNGPICPNPATAWPCSTTASTATTSGQRHPAFAVARPHLARPRRRSWPSPLHVPSAPPCRRPPRGRRHRCRVRPQRPPPDRSPPHRIRAPCPPVPRCSRSTPPTS